MRKPAQVPASFSQSPRMFCNEERRQLKIQDFHRLKKKKKISIDSFMAAKVTLELQAGILHQEEDFNDAQTHGLVGVGKEVWGRGSH